MDRRTTTERRHVLTGRRITAIFDAPSFSGKGYVLNISKNGMFLRSDVLPAPGEPVSVMFLDLSGGTVETSGTVRWTTEELDAGKVAKPGFGIRIEHASREYLTFYQSLLERSDDDDQRSPTTNRD